jgi:N-acetylglucosaminyldiphosphoundecaprenol N-acetyl-beta-D-mannosaminyltransferase
MPIIALNYANNNSLKTFIVGSDQNNHDIAINNIKEEYQNINLVGNLHGFHDPDYIYNEISIKQPDIILLAMGSPLQEKFALNLINYLDTGIIIGCGGALDIIAGKLKRAPSFWINNNLEWLYRVIQEPWRYKRQLFLPKFFISLIYAVCKKKLKTFLEKRF